MDLQWSDPASEARFSAYLQRLSGCLGHADRVGPFRGYCTGLLLAGERKSVEPMAARLCPERTSAEHQSLLHFVGQSPWEAETLLAAVREAVVPALTARAPLEVWIVDDTGVPKKGEHSVGVAHQYCGQRGKQENCQVAVTLSVATSEASLPIAHQLYLPEHWADDRERRSAAGVPEEVVFRSKSELALEAIETALSAGVAPGVVVADAGYGNNSGFRDRLSMLGLGYVVQVLSDALVWPPGSSPAVPEWDGRGRRPTRLRDGAAGWTARGVRDLADGLPATAWREVRWRDGTAGMMASRFAALRVRPAQGDRRGRETPRPEHWLLIEWPENEPAPTKFWFSNLAEETSIERLVHLAKLRWLIERDYRELKQELGLGHYQGRSWRGFHHHAALCIAAYGFLLAERAALPPSAARASRMVQAPELPEGYLPRGRPAQNRTTRPPLDRHAETTHRASLDQNPATMPMLRQTTSDSSSEKQVFMTQ